MVLNNECSQMFLFLIVKGSPAQSKHDTERIVNSSDFNSFCSRAKPISINQTRMWSLHYKSFRYCLYSAQNTGCTQNRRFSANNLRIFPWKLPERHKILVVSSNRWNVLNFKIFAFSVFFPVSFSTRFPLNVTGQGLHPQFNANFFKLGLWIP